MTADTIQGPRSKPIDLKVPFIDPGHVATPDGKRFLHLSGGHAVELASDGLSTVGPVKQVFEALAHSEGLADRMHLPGRPQTFPPE